MNRYALLILAVSLSIHTFSFNSEAADSLSVGYRSSFGFNMIQTPADPTRGWLINGDLFSYFGRSTIYWGPHLTFGDVSWDHGVFGAGVGFGFEVPLFSIFSLNFNTSVGGINKFNRRHFSGNVIYNEFGSIDEPSFSAMAEPSAALEIAFSRTFGMGFAVSYLYVSRMPSLSAPFYGLRMIGSF